MIVLERKLAKSVIIIINGQQRDAGADTSYRTACRLMKLP